MRVRSSEVVEADAGEGLRARALTRSFAKRMVLAGADIDVPPRTLAALEGPNGAGKTTLLRIFATLVRPERGLATVDGYDVTRSGAEVRERIGVAFVNERSLYWRLSGRENLRLFARTRGVARRAAVMEVDALVEALGMGEFAGRWVSDMSAGQRQRLAIARASLSAPSCLLIDEPLRGLDDAGTAMTLSFLAAEASRGAAVLVTAPQLGELRSCADVCYRLNEGAVESWPKVEVNASAHGGPNSGASEREVALGASR